MSQVQSSTQVKTLVYDGANQYLQPIANVATKNPSQFIPTQAQLNSIPDYFALYFSGMALVIELTPYVA